MAESDLSIMHVFALRSNWNGLLARLESHPDEAFLPTEHENPFSGAYEQETDDDLKLPSSLVHSTKIAPIHIICTRPDLPIKVLEAFLHAKPTSIGLLTSRNYSPLHLACYSGQPLDVIRLLAQADLDAFLLQDAIWGHNVFHVCVQNAKRLPWAIPALIEIGGHDIVTRALANENSSGKTPLHLACASNSIIQSAFVALLEASNIDKWSLIQELWKHYQSKLTKAMRCKPPSTNHVSQFDPSPYSHVGRAASMAGFMLTANPNDAYPLSECWYKLNFVLGAIDDLRIPTFPLLHECIRQDLQHDTLFFDMILRVNPRYACQIDADGDLPLHVVARLAKDTSKWRWRIETLMRLYPKAASVVNNQGKLPLELLRDVSWDHVRSVLLRSPLALSKLRLPETLYADIFARIQPLNWKANFIFISLKGTPSLLARR